MPRKKHDNRISVSFDDLALLRLAFFAEVKNSSRSVEIESIVLEKLFGNPTWKQVRALLRQMAVIKGIPLEQHLQQCIENQGLSEKYNIRPEDWVILLAEEEGFPSPETDEDEGD